MAQTFSMRGLKNFITDLRNAPNREIERARVDKELANIRMKFKSDKPLSSYDKQKYVWKLLYIYMLGYEVEFGHMQILDLVRSTKYGEKQVGYLAATLLLNEQSELARLFINSILQDLKSRHEGFQCLALAAASNLGGREFAENLAGEVQTCLTSLSSRPIVRKKAALCLLRLFRKAPEVINHDEFSSMLYQSIDNEKDLGVLLCFCNLLGGLVALTAEPYTRCSYLVVQLLARLDANRDIPQTYTYYGLASPFLQVRCLRILQYFPPAEDPSVARRTCDVILSLLKKTDLAAAKNPNKNNAVHAVLFEGIALALYLDPQRRYGDMTHTALDLLGSLVSCPEPNIRYLALESFARLSVVPGVPAALRQLQDTVIEQTRVEDSSLKRRALDLLFILCDESNVETIVQVLLDHMLTSDPSTKEELALKIAILAERYAPSPQWYVDAAMMMMERGGQEVTDDVWHRLVQVISNNPSLQPFAARRVHQALATGVGNEVLVRAAGYILGEFARTQREVSPLEIFEALHQHFGAVSGDTRGLLLSAYMKLLAGTPPAQRDPSLLSQVRAVFQRYERSTESELQQRSVQYLSLLNRPDLHTQVFDILPALPERKLTESRLMARLKKREGESVEEEVAAAQAASVYIPEGALTTVAFEVAQPAPQPAPAPVPAAAAPAAPALVDLLSDLDLGAPAAAPPAARTLNPFDDIIGEPHPAPAPVGAPPIEPELPLEDCYKKLVSADQGVLYQDQFLQIGVKAMWRGAQGRVQLFFGNRGQVPLEGLQLSVDQGSDGTWRSALMQAVPDPLPAGAQIPVTLAVALVRPGKQAVELGLSYRAQGRVCSQRFKAPAPMTKFLTPVTGVNSEQFFARWKALGQSQLMAHAAEPLVTETLSQRLHAMQFGVLQGIDPNARNIVAAATVTSEGTPGRYLCLLRMEINPSDARHYRITVASEDASLAEAVRDLIVSLYS